MRRRRIVERLERGPGGTGNGFVGWLMVGLRRRLLLAGLLLFAAPALFGVFLWRASSADKLYTTKVPLLVYNYSSKLPPVAEVLDAVAAVATRDYLAEPAEFLGGHRWLENADYGGVRYQFLSVLTTSDLALATTVHRELVARFAEFANERFPDLRFAAGDAVEESNSLAVDDSAVRRNTRLSLLCGISAYAAGLALLALCVVQVRWEFG